MQGSWAKTLIKDLGQLSYIRNVGEGLCQEVGPKP